MLKRFLSIFIVFFVLFVTQSQVFAATKQVNETQKNMAQYTYAINTETVLNEQVEAPYQLASERTYSQNTNGVWILSILVAGLGQILMGDVSGGLLWMLKVYIVPIVIFYSSLYLSNFLFQNTGSAQSPISFILFVAGPILFVMFYIANIFDAYSMSQGQISALEVQEKLAQLQSFQRVAENVSLINGNISYKVLAF